MLTGGRTASTLYHFWSVSPAAFEALPSFTIYFSDERCVPPNHSESNYGMVMRTLFRTGIPANCTVHRIRADEVDLDAAAVHYSALLPESIDVLLLSVGEDGHIASLFPFNTALHESSRLVVPIRGPKPPFQRLTITPPVIQRARKVFVLAQGEQKRAAYEKVLQDPLNIDEIPARLALRAEWIFDLNKFDLSDALR
jgi:6-phosphogluconolactonase